MEWIEKLDEPTKESLKTQINITHNYEEALRSAKDPLVAQLWLAVANLSRQIKDIKSKLDYLERALQESHKEKMKTTSKEEAKEIKEYMKKIMKGKKK
ncbi:MAG: hypothetical protein AABW41_03590 [Nanoarchaeota archaeon]